MHSYTNVIRSKNGFTLYFHLNKSKLKKKGKTREFFVFGKSHSAPIGHDSKPFLRIGEEEIEKVSCGWEYTLFYTKFGELYLFGVNYHKNFRKGFSSDPILLLKDDGVKSICCGLFHSLILKVND